MANPNETPGVTTQPPAAGTQQTPAASQTKEPAGAASPPQPAASTTPAAAGTPGEKNVQVPLSMATQMREEMQSLKQRLNIAESQNALYRANAMNAAGGMVPAPAGANASPAPAPAQVSATSVLEKIADLGDNDVITKKDFKKLVEPLVQSVPVTGGLSPEVEKRLALMEVRMVDPQYENTIRTYLPDVANTNPGVMQLIASAPNPIMAALTYARLSPRFTQAQAQPAGTGVIPAAGGNGTPAAGSPDPNAAVPINTQLPIMDQINLLIDNSMKPGAVDQVTGQGGISHADVYATMSDEDFNKKVASVMAGGK